MSKRPFLLIWLFVILTALACSKVPVMRGEIAGIQDTLVQAERNGAKRCAPRELALGQAHAAFASVELDQADMFRAEDHLMIARTNAQAAYDMSPAAKCTSRKFTVQAMPEPGDRDGDGLVDNQDTCPDQPENYQGYEDEDGCPDDPDTDGDGITDSKDACELLAEDLDGYLDNDGCPEIDNDLDGVPDTQDGPDGSCKNDPEDMDGYEDADGCPDPDNDSDQVPDLKDQCPMVPGAKDGPKPGCPKKPTLVVVTEKEIKITQQIHFAFGKAVIRPISFKVLDAVADVMQNNPKIRLEIQGHTDNRGSARLNKRLSGMRADSVRKYLEKHGVDGSRLVARGYGMDKPVVPNTNARNRALNRRVQFVRTEKNK